MAKRQQKGSPSIEERLLSLEETAACLGVSIRTLRRYRERSRIEWIRVGRRMFCPISQVQALQSEGDVMLNAYSVGELQAALRPLDAPEFQALCTVSSDTPVIDALDRLRALFAW